ncbi:MAG TPA: hypothetical protein G4N93_03340 [Dehalococcoidia bacterium]|nr:hypothetical protein [Dehalococcoidia bacterium]
MASMKESIVTYMTGANSRYKYLSGILIGMYRHGLTHEWQPRDIKLSNGTVLRWRVIRAEPKDIRLLIVRDRDGTLLLNMVLTELLHDLSVAIKAYLSDLHNNVELRATADEVMNKLNRPISQADFQRKCRGYVDNATFDYILANVISS